MLDLDQLQEIVSTLRRNLLRTILTAIGVFWGVMMLVVMVGFGHGLEGGVRRDMDDLASNAVFVWGEKTSLPYRGNPPGKWVQLTRADAAALTAAIPEIEAIAPRAALPNRGGQELVTRGDKSGPFNVMGDVPDYLRIQPERVEEGRFLNRLDIERSRKVAVIGVHVAEILFPSGRPVGQTIRIKQSEYVVVGVTRSVSTGDAADRQGNTIHLPLTTFLRTFRPDGTLNNFGVLVRADADAEQVERRIHDELARLHHFSKDDPEAVGSWNANKEYKKITGLFSGISLLIWFVGAVTLAAGIVGVSNIMMISVRERTREIGVRRAIGATPFAVASQILKESTLLTALAGYLGLAAGVLALEGISRLMAAGEGSKAQLFDPPQADFRVGLAATAIVVAGGAIAGLFPAIAAIRVRPVVALRDE